MPLGLTVENLQDEVLRVAVATKGNVSYMLSDVVTYEEEIQPRSTISGQFRACVPPDGRATDNVQMTGCISAL
jgi:hypothetical protein